MIEQLTARRLHALEQLHQWRDRRAQAESALAQATEQLATWQGYLDACDALLADTRQAEAEQAAAEPETPAQA